MTYTYAKNESIVRKERINSILFLKCKIYTLVGTATVEGRLAVEQ
jgi:hypothetical protein